MGTLGFQGPAPRGPEPGVWKSLAAPQPRRGERGSVTVTYSPVLR